MTNLLIFGTGAVSDIVLDNYLDFSKACILAFINSDNASEKEKRGHKVISIKEIIEYQYDYILIAAGAFDTISQQCIDAGVPEDKIIGVIQQGSSKLNTIVGKVNDDIKKTFNLSHTAQFFRRDLPEFVASSYYIANELFLNKHNITSLPETIDPQRLHTLFALSREIISNHVEGCIAELGVYKGDFAKILNEIFPDKTLYLFDTFRGFSDADIEIDKANNYSDNSSLFLDTSVELVLSKMPYKNKCKIVKGYFPESAANINDVFSFVSIDADLFAPIYNGLVFFYERLSRNGYLFIHDFNNTYYSGAREAVMKFCNEKGIGYCPTSDFNGSVIISK